MARRPPHIIDVGGRGPDPAVIRLRDERLERLLGTAIPRAEAADILRRLEFGVAEAGTADEKTIWPPCVAKQMRAPAGQLLLSGLIGALEGRGLAYVDPFSINDVFALAHIRRGARGAVDPVWSGPGFPDT